MGKGTKPKEETVKKQLDFKSTTAIGGGGARRSSKEDTCLITISFDIMIARNTLASISPSDHVVVTLSSSGRSLDTFVAGTFVGPYTGSNQSLILSCIKQNYIYEGTVSRVEPNGNDFKVSCEIMGHTK